MLVCDAVCREYRRDGTLGRLLRHIESAEVVRAVQYAPRELRANRFHDASYDGYEKDSRSLLTEVITVKPKGAIPLVYEILTGNAPTSKGSIVSGGMLERLIQAAEDKPAADDLLVFLVDRECSRETTTTD